MNAALPQQSPVCFVGIDLALCAKHKLAVLDANGQAIGRAISFGHGYDQHQAMLQAVTDRVPPDARIIWALEPTSGMWMPSASFLAAHDQTVVLQKAIKVAELRRYHKRHFKSDPADAQTIAETTRLDHQRGLALTAPPSPDLQARRALARRINKLHREVGSTKNRLISLLCHTLLPTLADDSKRLYSASMLHVLHHFADLRLIAQRSRKEFISSARGVRKGGPRTKPETLGALHDAVRDSFRVFGDGGVDWESYAFLIREVIERIWHLEQDAAPLEQRLATLLERDCPPVAREAGVTVPGVADHTLSQTLALFGPPGTWARFGGLKQYGGMVPIVDASGQSESGFVMSKLGEPIVRKLVYLMGNTARQCDAEFAACYYDQMVHKGKGHTAACIATGLKVLNVLRAVLRDQRPYQPVDPVSGLPISSTESRRLAKTVYRVPDDVRNARRKGKHSEATTAAGSVKDTPEALPGPGRERVPSLC